MRYLVLLYGDPAAAAAYGTPEFEAEMAAYDAFGELAGPSIVGGEALHGDDTCQTVRVQGGVPRVTAGPFAESVEVLGGFYVLDVPSLDDAIELARHIPATSYGAAELRPLVQWIALT